MENATKATLKQDYQLHEQDTGSVEVQVALLSKRIQDLTQHLQQFKKDHNSRRTDCDGEQASTPPGLSRTKRRSALSEID